MTRILFTALLLTLAGCQQQMARQPSYRPLQPSPLFSDGMASRPLVPGTIHRDFVAVSGKKPVAIKGWQRAAGLIGNVPVNPLAAAATVADWSIYVDAFP